MSIFETNCGKIGKIASIQDEPATVWLVPDCLNVFHWRSIPERVVDINTVTDVDLSRRGFTEICKDIYMKTSELQTHRNTHDPTVVQIAPEDAMFTRASGDTEFVRDVHLAVTNWPTYVPRNTMGRRLWETINNISRRALLDEDNKRFLTASSV